MISMHSGANAIIIRESESSAREQCSLPASVNAGYSSMQVTTVTIAQPVRQCFQVMMVLRHRLSTHAADNFTGLFA